MKDIGPVFAAVLAFVFSAVSGKFFIPFLQKLHFGQSIREEGPKWHQKKQGTPTMGGIMIIIAVLLGTVAAAVYSYSSKGAVYSEFGNSYTLVLFLASVSLSIFMGLIGFIDDYIKVVKKQNLGLTARQKTVLQSLATLGYLITLGLAGMNETWLPFLGFVNVNSGLGLIFWPVSFFFIYGFVNAVNLTDGIDGLASSVTLVVSVFFMYLFGIKGIISPEIFSCALIGALIGFLIWNAHPAKVFMGDTGSLFLGGAVVGLAYCSERPVLLLLAGIVYLIEAFSVVLQVAYYKKTKKRLFKMSPIHHHFEMSGWSENKIVIVFSLLSVLAGVLSGIQLLG